MALFNLSGTSFFMYLRIRSVLRAYGVPWDSQLPVHPFRKIILPTDNSVISASVIYSFLLKNSYKPLSISTICSKVISEDIQTLFTEQIWETITSFSKNPNHQMIHWKLLYRLYLSALKRFYIYLSHSHLAPKLWNGLPDIVRGSDSLSQFKTRLKTHLFSQAFT